MKKINRILTCIPLILMVLTGCVIGARVESPVVIEPVPVTPIAPPEGIRGTLSVDPRVYIEQQQGESEFLMPQENQTGLGLCFPQGEGVQEVEAYANEVDNFRADVYMQVCGWERNGMPIDVMVELPNGQVLEEEVETERLPNRSAYYASYYWTDESSDMFGPVRFTFSNQGRLLSDDESVVTLVYEVVLPEEPRVYSFESGTVWLYGFEPNEAVQLLRYDVSQRGFVEWEGGGGITETYSLVDQQMVIVDENGAKALNEFGAGGYGPYGPQSHVVAIGPISGEVNERIAMFVEESVLLEE